MKSNNSFANHGIEHLSISKINLWITDPAKFVATYLCKVPSSVGVGAFRGTSVEFALSKYLEDRTLSDNLVDEYMFSTFDKECIENNINTQSEVALKEKKTLNNYFNQAKQLYKDTGQAEFYQHKLLLNIDEDLPIPFLGYIDFVFKDDDIGIRDLKTTARMPSKMSEAHSRQLALYSLAFPNKSLWCDYVTPKQTISYMFTDQDKKLKEIIKISLGLMKFLSISDDPYELASMFYPDLDSWMWNEEYKTKIKTIWSNE